MTIDYLIGIIYNVLQMRRIPLKEETVILRLDTKLKKELLQLAEERGSSVSQVIRQAVLEHLRKSKKERG